ncbi:MAG TPA: cation transporter [Gemmataceae bacterium]|nr:cation transporter [Gemmataceae bacterium]
MQFSRWMVSSGLMALLACAGVSRAETKVELTNVHLCCRACVAAVGNILKEIPGVEGKCDQQSKTVTITAADEKTAQKALDALAKGGFHGKTANKELSIKDDSGVKKGKVQTLTVAGVHDCCNSCNNAIKAALKKVDGVKGNTATAKKDSFEVTGDFDAAELIKALNDAGFHVKVKQ